MSKFIEVTEIITCYLNVIASLLYSTYSLEESYNYTSRLLHVWAQICYIEGRTQTF
jgi:hypothetical protein